VKAARYETALIGEWHLDRKPEFGPNRHGYDEVFGILSGAGDYFTHPLEWPGTGGQGILE
jgi:arylsulfatase A-like enzyme